MQAADYLISENGDPAMTWNRTRWTPTTFPMFDMTVLLSTTGLLLINETLASFDNLTSGGATLPLSTMTLDMWPVTNLSTMPAGDNRSKPWPTLKQPVYAVVLLSAAYLLVAIVGVVSNGMVVIVIFRNVRMRTVTNYFLSNLALADILVCIFVLPITLLDNIFTEWWYGPTVCKIAPYLQGVSVSSSVNTLAAVAVERYMAIFNPATSRMTRRTAALVIGSIWLVPFGLFVPWVFVYREKLYNVTGFNYVACHAEWQSLDLNRAFTLGVVFITCYLIPLAFIAICYLMIGIKVYRRRVSGLRRGSRAEQNITRSKTKILRMLVVVFVMFTLSWLPLYSVGLRLLFGLESMSTTEKTILKKYVLPVAQWLGASNSCVNPFIYCYFSCSFRLAIRQVMGNNQEIRRETE